MDLEKEVEEMMEYGKAFVAPIEEELKVKEVNPIYGFLVELKRYVDWVNADSLHNLSCTNFKVLIDKIKRQKR